MITKILIMDGYGIYVWSAFVFTFFSFVSLYVITKTQYVKEKNKFVAKFGTLNSQKADFAKSQSINKEILSNTSNI
jgi:heme exporter protein D|tara:strand:+ start:797 stop:1024 length:228 start_codon:yes stop_codon:yes gene_type:complete